MNPDWKLYAAGLCFIVVVISLLVNRAKGVKTPPKP